MRRLGMEEGDFNMLGFIKMVEFLIVKKWWRLWIVEKLDLG